MWRLFLCVLAFSYETSSYSLLYKPEDNVRRLNASSLAEVLGSPEKGKLLQFMNAFCSHCVEFSATYRSLARNLYPWRHLVEVLVMDCGEDVNVQVCREYNVLHTPTLRYFPPGFRRSPNDLGEEVEDRQPEDIARSLAWSISNSWFGVRGAARLGPLTYYDNVETVSETRQLYDGRPWKYIVLVLQPTGSRIGVETILELSSIPYLDVRILENRWIFSNFGLSSSDLGLAIVDRGENGLYLRPANNTGQAYAHAVRQYLRYFSQEFEETPPLTEGQSAADFQANLTRAILMHATSEPRRVFRADLERGIQRFIYTELRNRTDFAAENRTALVSFFDALYFLNPLNKNGQKMSFKLRHVLRYAAYATGQVIGDTVASLERSRGKVFMAKHYIGCTSSQDSLRGYPCSLWTLFHYWTVNNARLYRFAPGTILKQVRQFVSHLFACPDCARTYEDLVLRLDMDKVITYDQEILWLWTAHNEINRQLSGKPSEDPAFPKLQFPSPISCPECRDKNGDWQKDQVLKYLKRLYDGDNLGFYGLPTHVGYT